MYILLIIRYNVAESRRHETRICLTNDSRSDLAVEAAEVVGDTAGKHLTDCRFEMNWWEAGAAGMPM